MAIQDGAILRASARWNDIQSSDIVNVWWFRCDFTSPQSETVVADAIDTVISNAFIPFDNNLSLAQTPVDLKIDRVEHINGEWKTIQNVSFSSWGSTIVPADSGHYLPPGVSIVGFLKTGIGKHTGRRFLGGFTESTNDAGGNAGSTTITNVISGLATLIIPHVITTGNTLVSVVADQLAGIVRDIVEVSAQAGFGYQRRRTPGRGS